jgi:esterase/lipase
VDRVARESAQYAVDDVGSGEGVMATAGVSMRGRRGLMRSVAGPAADYAAAVAKFEALRAQDGANVNPVCGSKLLTHGERTKRAVVLVHGLSNCPQQLAQFSPLLFERGCNVLIPRMPHNGTFDREGRDMRFLTAAELCRFSDAIADIAQGLGERVTVAGLSGGGVIVAWLAQHRADVDRTVLIAPAFGVLPTLPVLNDIVNRGAIRLLQLLPNMMTEKVRPYDGPKRASSGFATKGLAAMMLQGLAVTRLAKRRKPLARSIQVVLNENDSAVNNAMTRELMRLWERRGVGRLAAYTFGKELGLIHDLIDPEQPKQQTSLVYPILRDLVLDE